MKTYEFTAVLDGSPELTEEMADKLYAAGCDDGTPSQHCGVASIGFSREAVDLESAIRSAIANVSSAGYTVAKVEIEDAALARI